MARYVYVGGGTDMGKGKPHLAEGITFFQFANGGLELRGKIESGKNPSFLALHPNRRFLFAVNESGGGAASAFMLDSTTGTLTLINRVPVHGDAPCYVTVSPDGTRLLIANYSSGSLTVLPIQADGRLGDAVQQIQHEGHSGAGGPVRSIDQGNRNVWVVERGSAVDTRVNPGRQDHAHAHSVIFDPSGEFALSADLGMDRIWVYRYQDGLLHAAGDGVQAVERDGMMEYRWIDDNWQIEAEELPRNQYAGISTEPGAGPRHMAFHPNGSFLYVANELNNTVAFYHWDGDGKLRASGVHSTLPGGFTGENTVAQILLTPDGRFLYVSNRGHNSLAMFSVDAETGNLTPFGHVSSGGNWPRNFAIDPDGKYLLAANQYSESVIGFQIDQANGTLSGTGVTIEVHEPMFVLFVDV